MREKGMKVKIVGGEDCRKKKKEDVKRTKKS